jgi:hypothetical protein
VKLFDGQTVKEVLTDPLNQRKPIMTDKEKLQKALELLDELFQQADEDCPQENRSRHFVDTFEEAEEFLVEMGVRKYD